VAPLLALIIGLGVYPQPVLDVINPPVKRTLEQLDQSDPAPTVDVSATTQEGSR
jgi:NADH-quinone oxidoreductase subunit M